MSQDFTGADANPYRAPATNLDRDGAPTEAQIEQMQAGRGRRFGTLVVDYLCFMLFAFITGMVIVLVFGASGAAVLRRTPDILLGSLLMFVFYAFFEGLWARTPGKLLFGTRVVNEEGGPPSFKQILIRNLCRFIPFEPFSYLLSPRGWHDQIAHTRVGRTRGV